MPIKEESFRIGSGRYLQGAGYISSLGEEILRLGTAPLIIGGKTALSLTEEKIRESLSREAMRYAFVTHTGTCSDLAAERLSERAATYGLDVIVGVGGGVICDLAKLVADRAGLPVINIPTSSATCAAYTPLSVRYTDEGCTVGSRHFKCEVDCVIADTEIILTEPPRLLLSGVFDALAKLVEIKQRYTEGDECPLGLDYAYAMSQRTYQVLTEDTPGALSALRDGAVTPPLERVVFASIAATGVISGIARGSNQTAIAHKLYEITRTLYPEITRPYLHGEIVGVGLLVQNHYNGEVENNDSLLSLMKKYGMPYSMSSFGIEPTDEALNEYYDRLVDSSAMEACGAPPCPMLASLTFTARPRPRVCPASGPRGICAPTSPFPWVAPSATRIFCS